MINLTKSCIFESYVRVFEPVDDVDPIKPCVEARAENQSLEKTLQLLRGDYFFRTKEKNIHEEEETCFRKKRIKEKD